MNEKLKQFILSGINEKNLSHAFLIETNNFEKCLSDLKKIIKIINCKEKYVDKCEKCNLCYQKPAAENLYLQNQEPCSQVPKYLLRHLLVIL